MSNPDLSRQKIRQLLAVRLEAGSRRVAMLAFLHGEERVADAVDDNGTASLVQTPNGKFIVTNFHVWNEFRNLKDEDDTYQLVLTGHGLARTLDLSNAEIISENHELDLCILSFPADRIEAAGKEFYILDDWPPQRAVEGDEVVIIGYPGMRRRPEDLNLPQSNTHLRVLRHESVFLGLHVEAVSTLQARLRFTNPEPTVENLSEMPITEFRWGGMSGSLAYRLDLIQNRLKPCGILHSAGIGLEAIFYMTHLDFLKADGTLSQA